MWNMKRKKKVEDDYPWKENFEEEERSKTAATWSPFANFLMRVFFPIFLLSTVLFLISMLTLTGWLFKYSMLTMIVSFAIWFYAFISLKDNTGATYFYDEIL